MFHTIFLVINCAICIWQEREVKSFREGLKQEWKLLKHEIDMLPRDQRKDATKRRKEEKEIEQQEKVNCIFFKQLLMLLSMVEFP